MIVGAVVDLAGEGDPLSMNAYEYLFLNLYNLLGDEISQFTLLVRDCIHVSRGPVVIGS